MSQLLLTPTHDHSQGQFPVPISLQHPCLESPTIKHIPKAARPECARALANVMNNISSNSLNVVKWSILLNYGKEVLVVPPRAGKKVNLPNIIKSRNTNYINRAELVQSAPDRNARTTRKDFNSLSSDIT